MRILVTGSRDWDQPKIIFGVLGQLAREHGHDNLVLVHGGCPTGADAIAHRYAEDMDWGIQVYPADWGYYGKAAGPLRNRDMVDSGVDLCLAFIKNGSRGATQCASYAEFKGVLVWRYLA